VVDPASGDQGVRVEEAFAIDCPKCGVKNWASNGDPEDVTTPDVEAIRCWKCKHVFWLPGAVDVRETLRASLDIADAQFVEDGQKTLR
jgi:hypothetical protein